MTVHMDETFTTALRELLVEQAQTDGTRRARLRWPRRWSARAAIGLAVLAGGGGIAAAADEVLSSGGPGSQKLVALAAPVTASGDGSETVRLGTPPPGANAIEIYFSCLTPGTFTFHDGSGVKCGKRGGVSNSIAHPSFGPIALSPGRDSTAITAAPGERWRLTAVYVTDTTNPWKVNASGQTYGTPKLISPLGHGLLRYQRATPDLVAVQATNGRDGYVYARQLQGPQPTGPSQAATWNQTHQASRTVTVYESNGKTAIGQFNAGS
jgi:hypothetical protein